MMQYKGYLSRVDFDDEANIFHGEVINIRDVVTFQGETVNELHRAFEESIEDYLAFCAERGEEPSPPFSGRFTVISTPYHGYWKNLMLALTGKMDAHFTALWDHGHIKFWSMRTLGELLREGGVRGYPL
jgi:predicted HicB family RNase H-like nuclease